jgi:hypothetical protein
MIVYNLILFILLNFGISFIITNSFLFQGFRNYVNKIEPKLLGKLVTCILCAGVWIGFLLSLVYSPSFMIFTHIRIISIFLDGIFGGITSYIICVILDWLKNKNEN